MQMVWSRYVDNVEIVGSDKLLVIAISLLEPQAGRELRGSLFTARTNSYDILFGMRSDRLNESLGYPTRAQDSPSQNWRVGCGFNSGCGQRYWERHRMIKGLLVTAIALPAHRASLGNPYRFFPRPEVGKEAYAFLPLRSTQIRELSRVQVPFLGE
jgi:hypothetical protein